MNKRLFRLLALILALCVLTVCFAAAENAPELPEALDEERQETEAPPEEDSHDSDAAGLTPLLGEGKKMQIDLMSGIDTPGARYIFMGYKSWHRGLAVLVRITDKDVIMWEMERTEENLEKIRQVFDPDAPMCCIAAYESKQVKKSALYLNGSEEFPYDSFLAEAEKVIRSLPGTRPFADVSAGDPLLSELHGITWEMNREELKKTIGRAGLMESGSTLIVRKNTILNGTVTYTIMIEDDRTVRMIVTVPDDKAKSVQSRFTVKYGEPDRTTYGYAMIGKPNSDPNGDTLVWMTGDTFICMRDNTVIYVPYTP